MSSSLSSFYLIWALAWHEKKNKVGPLVTQAGLIYILTDEWIVDGHVVEAWRPVIGQKAKRGDLIMYACIFHCINLPEDH